MAEVRSVLAGGERINRYDVRPKAQAPSVDVVVLQESIMAHTAYLTRVMGEFDRNRQESIEARVEAGLVPERTARAQAEALAREATERLTTVSTETAAARREAQQHLATIEELRRAPPLFKESAYVPLTPDNIELLPQRDSEGRIAQIVLKAPGQEERRLEVRRGPNGSISQLVFKRK